MAPVKHRYMIYVAGSYTASTTAGRVRNIHEAWEMTLQLIKLGWAPHCPHLNTQLMDGEVDYETFMEVDFNVIQRCDALIVLPEWEHSQGTLREIAYAKQLGKPIYYWPYDARFLEQLSSLEAASIGTAEEKISA